MKETGLMFKAPLVRSILEGSKTQTRRLVKPAPARDQVLRVIMPPSGTPYAWSNERIDSQNLRRIRWDCQAGGPGDRIYVRETWNWFDPQEIPADRVGPRAPFTGIAGGERPIEWVAAFAADGPLPYQGYDGRDHWRPSIHMPKWAARIWLDITGVRVERLQDISEADCLAEGAHGGHGSIPGYAYSATPQENFQHIWESTGGDWAANPWVWVIDFKRGTAQKGQP